MVFNVTFNNISVHHIELPFNIKRGLGIPFTGRSVVVVIAM
jgi:hypothetical protein